MLPSIACLLFCEFKGLKVLKSYNVQHNLALIQCSFITELCGICGHEIEGWPRNPKVQSLIPGS